MALLTIFHFIIMYEFFKNHGMYCTYISGENHVSDREKEAFEWSRCLLPREPRNLEANPNLEKQFSVQFQAQDFKPDYSVSICLLQYALDCTFWHWKMLHNNETCNHDIIKSKEVQVNEYLNSYCIHIGLELYIQ